MKNLIKKFLILPLFLLFSPLFGQTYSTGALLDPVRYERINIKPVLVSRSYGSESLPRKASLMQYSPIPESQGNYSTCVGWATAFAARTISESIALNRTDRTETSNNVFSPIFVYKNIQPDPTGQRGSFIDDALVFMRDVGAVKRLPFERTTDFPLIILTTYTNSRRYRIADYVRLFSEWGPGTIANRVDPVKKSLSEGKPVIIGMNTPVSFFIAKDQWRPYENPNSQYGGHAMCVVGYDDDMYGGAFEVQNSWGANWGNDGYIWISYSTFAAFVDEAYEIIEDLTQYREATRYAASIGINVSNDNRGMPVTYDSQGFYRTRYSYPQGTQFQFQMTNRYPAYVYAFSADDSSSDIERIFPMPGVSPVLDYTDSTVAWPGEREAMEIASTAGTHYLVVLYSKQALDIEAIERRFAAERGTFPERVARAVGTNFIPYRNVQYNSSSIEFSAESTNPRAVFALLLAIDHQ
jgi:hypothetical protein